MIARARALFGSIRPWDLCAISVAAAVAILGACASVSGGDGTRVSADLLQRARRTGEIKVIVQLRVDSGASEQAIEATKVALLAEIANTDYKVVREFRGLPLMALEASYATLTILNSSPRVLRVEEDSLARPQG